MLKNILEDFNDFEAYREDWERLLEGLPADSPFLTFEWLSTWWRHFHKDHTLIGILFKEGPQVTGIIPLMGYNEIVRLYPLRKISFVGTGLSDRADFIMGGPKAQVVQSLLEYFAEDFRKWDVIHLEQIPEESDSIGLLKHLCRKKGFLMECWEQSVCPYIVLTRDLAQSMDQRGKDLKREIRKNNLRLEDLGKVSFSRSITHEQVDDLIRTATFVDEKSHKLEAAKTLFTQHENREFLRHISQTFAKRRWLDFATLELDDVPIAYEFHFRYKEKVYAYTGSYDDGFADFSPGIGILYRLVQNSIDLGLKEYDLLQGGHTYKWKWTSKGRKQYQIMIINDTYYARMFHYLKFKTRSPREDGMEESGISGEPSRG